MNIVAHWIIMELCIRAIYLKLLLKLLAIFCQVHPRNGGLYFY